MDKDAESDDRMATAAKTAAGRKRTSEENPEPSLGSRFGQIGILGWSIVVPILIAVVLGRWLDRTFDTGVFFTAPLIMLGAVFGFWSAWKWMHKH